MDARMLGVFERLLAYLVVIVFYESKEAIAVILAGWTGAKLLSNWHRGPYQAADAATGPTAVTTTAPPATEQQATAPKTKEEQDETSEAVWRTRTFIALMAGIVSLGFGVLGGLIAKEYVPLPQFLAAPWY
jgi:hypothetical protein